MRQFLVALYPTGGFHREVVIAHEGKATRAKIQSPWLVGHGQTLDVKVVVSEITDRPEAGDHLVDATALRRVVVSPTHDYRFIPSNRPLWEILADVVGHHEEAPTHGTNCACMDKFSYELKRHVSRVLPTDAPFGSAAEWAESFDARTRIRHVLRMVGNVL